MESYTAFLEGEVVIYEGHLKDVLQVVEKFDGNYIFLNHLNGQPSITTTPDRLRKASREALTNEILRLEASLNTLRGAMRNQSFSSTGLLKQAGVKWGETVKTYVRPEDQIPIVPQETKS